MKQSNYWYHTMLQGRGFGIVRNSAIAALAAVGLVGAIEAPLQAQTSEALSNATIVFPEDTIIEFEIVDTHGYYQSTFGVMNTQTNQKTPLFVEVRPYDEPNPSVRGRDDTGSSPDYLGTVAGGGVVNGEGQASQFIKHTFKAGVPYMFYLDSVDPVTKQVRTSYISTNPNSTRFSGDLVAGASGNLIEWDDSGLPRPGKDNDFDDFAIIAGGFTLAPCPIQQP